MLLCDYYYSESGHNLCKTIGILNQVIALPHELQSMRHSVMLQTNILIAKGVDGMLISFQRKLFHKGSPLAWWHAKG